MNPERIEFLNHVIILTSDPWNDVTLVHFDGRCIHRVLYPHRTDRAKMLNEAKNFAWMRELEAQRTELETFYENF